MADEQRPTWWVRLLDGDHVWGRVDLSPGTRGFKKLRLVVLPPGTGKVERRYVRLARSWPTWGVLLWLAAAIMISSLHLSMAAYAYMTAAILSVGAAAVVLAGSSRSQVRTMSAVIIAGFDDPTSAAKYAELQRLSKVLSEADAMRGRGDISIAEHEFAWWQVYESLAPKSSSPTQRS